MARPPTMRDVAELAGVGKATVSLALRNDPRIRASTRDKVRAAAEQLGYRADAAISQVMARLRAPNGLAFRGTFAVLDIASAIERHGIRPVQEIYSGCRRRAEELGYSLDLFHLNDPGTDPVRLPRVIESRGIRAVLFIGSSGNHLLPGSVALPLAHLPSVAIDLSEESNHLHRADTDLFGGVFAAVARSSALGYRRVGLVTEREEDRFAGYRLRAGYLAACHASGLDPIPVCEVARGEEKEEVARWAAEHAPDAVLAFDQRVRGAIPPGPGFASLDWTPDDPDCAGIDRNRPAVGSAAIDLLSSQVQRNETGVPAVPKQILVRARWVDGPTLPPARPAPSAKPKPAKPAKPAQRAKPEKAPAKKARRQ